MGNHLDAMFGRISSEGVALDLQGGINFKDGVEAIPNPAEGRTDVQATAAIRALLPLASVLRVTGISVIEGAGSLVLGAGFANYTGVFTGSAKSDAVLTAGANTAAFTYSGTAAARVLVIASFGVTLSTASTFELQIARDGVAAGGSLVLKPGATGYSGASVLALVPVVTGTVIALRAKDNDIGGTLTSTNFSMIAIAIEDAIS